MAQPRVNTPVTFPQLCLYLAEFLPLVNRLALGLKGVRDTVPTCYSFYPKKSAVSPALLSAKFHPWVRDLVMARWIALFWHLPHLGLRGRGLTGCSCFLIGASTSGVRKSEGSRKKVKNRCRSKGNTKVQVKSKTGILRKHNCCSYKRRSKFKVYGGKKEVSVKERRSCVLYVACGVIDVVTVIRVYDYCQPRSHC